MAQGGIKEQERILGLGPIRKERESGRVRAAGSLEKVFPKAPPPRQRGVRVRVGVGGGRAVGAPTSGWELFVYLLML